MTPTRLRFPQSARLKSAGEFLKMKREGASFHGKLFVLSVLKSAPDAATRIGLITSRRVGGAVTRNRVRRRLREILRTAFPRICPGTWLVVIARQSAAQATFQALQAEWETLARRGALLLPCG